MNINYIFLIVLYQFFIVSLLQALWFKLTIIVSVITGALIFHKVRIDALKDQKGELQRKLDERNELLTYSTDRERKAKEEAEQANNSKRALLTKISHEIRTPMNAVLGMASLLSETSLNSEQKDYSETIRSSGENLLTVINDILLDDVLAYSKVESGKAGLDQKDFDLVNNIEEVLEVFSSKTAYAGIELIFHSEVEVPQYIIGDSLRFRQVLMNLVENAVKFTKQGEIIVRVYQVSSKGDTIELGIEVIDTGVGIPSDKLKTIANDFSDTNAVNEVKGTGLGLVICKRLVSLMGGRIEVESSNENGTTIKFTISAQLSPSASRNTINKDMASLEGKRVLVVDDNTSSRNAISNKLEQWKLVPTLAKSGSEAVEIFLANNNFDLIITDMQMPDVNGIELAKVVQQQNPLLPIILLAQEGDESYKQHPELFNSLVNKPIRQHSLSQHILSSIRHRGKASVPVDNKILSADFAQKYPLRILIAEDNRVNQKLALRVLGKLGYNPDIAQDGKEVLEEVSQIKYDLIFMDVRMPEMDGLEATRMIRLCLNVQPVIVAMTANTMQGDREECLQAGMDDYISKPINLEDLVNVLEKWALQVKAKQ